jgi:hypothetical protein
MPKKLYFQDYSIDEYDTIERYEQLQMGLSRLANPIYGCMPDDAPGQQRFMRLVELLDELDKHLLRELELMRGERVSPDAPMISRKSDQ